jgi:phage terminase small subunit
MKAEKLLYECAIEAGYEKDRARRYSIRTYSNPQKFPLVVKYIGEIREEFQKKYEVTYERHIAELGKIRQEALKKGAFSAANNAEVARGKAAGLYVEQKIIRTGKLDDMSKDEMERELKSILNEYSPLLQDVTPEDVKEKVKESRLPRVKKLN